MKPTVSRRGVRTNGLVGVLYRPDGLGPAPGVLLLGGSEGGLHERDAQTLAEHGFTVLALAYFGFESRPPGLVEIEVEYFIRAVDLLLTEPGVGDSVGVLGGSRGGEAALLIAAHDPRVAATVSVVGSGLVTAGIDFGRGSLLQILAASIPSWTQAGQALPFLPYQPSDELVAQVNANRPVTLRLAFPPVPADSHELERLSIPIERTTGAVLLISAEDDQNWPSSDYSNVAFQRMKAHGRAADVTHEVLVGAGHPIAGAPGADLLSTIAPGPGVSFQLGGTPSVNTAARARAWQLTVDFFEQHLT